MEFLLLFKDREVGGPMLSVTGINRFFYLRDFTYMCCKHSRVLSIICEQLCHEPNDGDVFIVMSRDCRIVRLFTYDNLEQYLCLHKGWQLSDRQ